MLTHPTFDHLNALGLHGMAKAFADIEATGEATSLSHTEWLTLLLEREATLRHDKRLATRLRYAKLRQQACIEDVDYRTPRGLDRPLFAKLVEGRWIDDHTNLLICGPAGVGKSWLASALGHKACRDNRSVLYQRVPRLFDDLALARGDGRHPRLLRGLGRVDLLILDDWGLEPLDASARHDLLEILEDRYGHRSTIVTSQLPVDQWHLLIGDPTYADAVLDRLVHNAHRLDLTGDSLRRTRQAAQKASVRGAVDMPLRLDNATTLPTCPQQPQLKHNTFKPRFQLTARLAQCQKNQVARTSRLRAKSKRRSGRHRLGIPGRLHCGTPGRLRRNLQARRSVYLMDRY